MDKTKFDLLNYKRDDRPDRKAEYKAALAKSESDLRLGYNIGEAIKFIVLAPFKLTWWFVANMNLWMTLSALIFFVGFFGLIAFLSIRIYLGS